MDTPANEHLTPKPLDQQVPGAWNFKEPQPGPAGQRIYHTVARAEMDTVPRDSIVVANVEPRLIIAPEARERLLETELLNHLPATEDDWREFEDALLEILFQPPARWVMGVEG